MAASAVPPVRGQHALQDQDSTSPVSRGVEDLRMEGVVVQAGSYRQSRRGKNLPGQCHQAVGEGESVAFGERQHVLGGVFWHCAPRDLDTGLPGAFLHQRLVPGRPLPRTSNRKENERRLPPSSTAEPPRIETSAAPSSTNESPPTLDPASRHRACSRAADGRLAGRPHRVGPPRSRTRVRSRCTTACTQPV
jgi:hypothetical protein